MLQTGHACVIEDELLRQQRRPAVAQFKHIDSH